MSISYGDVKEAADRIAGHIRPVAVAPLDTHAIKAAPRDPIDERDAEPCNVWVALEHLQHTGSFKARGALNLLTAHQDAGTLPHAGITIASGGNAGLACAWAATQYGVTATVFLPETAPQVTIERLRGYGATVRLVGTEYADALQASKEFAVDTGALASHAYDNPYIAAGAGTLVDEIRAKIPDLNTIIVAVGGGGLFTGIATAAQHHGLRTIGVEPQHCRALNAAIQAGKLVDVTVDSVAADSLGARRTSQMALDTAHNPDTHSILVPDGAIVTARQTLWDHHRLAVEHGAATALAALTDTHPYTPRPGAPASVAELTEVPAYWPQQGETVAVILCGANTDPSTLA